MNVANALNPVTGTVRAWLILAVMLLWLAIMGATLGTLYGVFRAGDHYGRTDEKRLALAADLERSETRADGMATFQRQSNDAIAAAAAVAQKAQASQRRVQEEFTAYVADHPIPDCRLPAGYGRVWQHANDQAHPATDVAPAPRDEPAGLPAAATAGERGAEHAAGEPSAGDGAVSNLRRSPAGADRMDQSAGAQ